MDMLADIKALKHHEVFFGVLCFLGIIAPGVLIVFHFKPSLFYTLDVVKIVILGLSLTLPVGFANYFIISMFEESKTPRFFPNTVLACLHTFLITYSLVFISYLFRFRFRTFLCLLITLEVIIFLVASLKEHMRPKEGKAEQ